MKRSEIVHRQKEVRAMLESAGLVVDPALEIEIADFGLGRYEQEGLGLVVRVNETEYCSKWLTLCPGQECPRHYHRIKKETFFVLAGEVRLWVDGETVDLSPGQSYTILPGARHEFRSEAGAIIEEVSTHDENSDSYFENAAVIRDPEIQED